MNRERRPLAGPAVIALIVLVSGCGSTAGGESSNGAGDNTAANSRQALKFAACMRRDGVSQFPDPSASGRLTIDAIANGSGLDTSTPAFRQAISACKDLEPAGFMGSRRNSQQQEAALRFAGCIRENGVPDFPDPVKGQPLIDTNRIPSANKPGGMSILNAAMHRCGAAAAAAGVTP